MTRRELVLAAMAAASGSQLSPVQVQKLFFLIDRQLGPQIEGPIFNFKPYHYGPFDRGVYEELETLHAEGLAETVPEATWRNYRLTSKGQAMGEEILDRLPGPIRDHIRALAHWILPLSFKQLVTAIYKHYPEMSVNSIFREEW